MVAQGIILAGAVVTVLYGGGSWIEDHYGKEVDIHLLRVEVQSNAQRLDNKIAKDNLQAVRERMYRLKHLYGERLERAPDSAREEFQRLLVDEEELISIVFPQQNIQQPRQRSSRDMVR